MRNTNNKTITITHMQQFKYFHSKLGDHLYAHRTHACLFISQDALFLQRANEKHLFRKQNLLPGSCNISSETFLASRKQILLPKEMFLIGPYESFLEKKQHSFKPFCSTFKKSPTIGVPGTVHNYMEASPGLDHVLLEAAPLCNVLHNYKRQLT